MSDIKRTMYETTNKDKADVVLHNPEDNLPGSGFCCLLIAGDNDEGEKELLELRFKSNFLKHIEKLARQLRVLSEQESEKKDDITEAAQALVDGDAEEMNPFVKEHHRKTKIQTVILGGDELSKEELIELKKQIIEDLKAKEAVDEDEVEYTIHPDPDITDLSTDEKTEYLAEISNQQEEAIPSVGDILDDVIDRHGLIKEDEEGDTEEPEDKK